MRKKGLINQGKSIKNNYLLNYSLVFGITAFLVFCYFIFSGRSMIVSGDGWKQHFMAFIYFGEYVRDIFTNLFVNHQIALPQWDFSIGYGGDIFTTLHYYVIGDPLDLLSALCPANKAQYLYSFLFVFRLYLAGLAFSAFCKYKKQKSSIAIISGSLIYVFITYTLLMVARHPFFANPMIYLPLLLLGVEKIIDKKRPYLLIIMVFISAISNFYFFYMLVIFTVIYVLIRICFVYNKATIKKAFSTLLKIGVSSVIGLLMSGAILLPVMFAFLSDSRGMSDVVVNLFYEPNYYIRLFSDFITSTTKAGYQSFIGLSSVSLIPICFAFLKRKKYTESKVFFALGTLFLLLPVFGHVFNGFSYIANRWIWAYSFVVAFLVVETWDDIRQITKKECKIIGVVLAVYLLICALVNSVRGLFVILAIIFALIALSVYAFRGKFKRQIFADGLILVLIVATIFTNGFNFYSSTTATNYAKNYVLYSDCDEKINNSISNQVKAETKSDSSFFRYSGNNLVYNTDVVDKTYGTSFYWSIQNPNIAQFMDEMNMPIAYLYQYKDLNRRSILNNLMGCKYYYSTTKSKVPYGYKKFNNNVFKSSNALPLGFTYSKYILKSDYDKLTALEKQQALLQGAVVDSAPNIGTKANIKLYDKNIDYTITTDENVKRIGNKYVVMKNGSTITLNFNGLELSEAYFSATLKDYTYIPELATNEIPEENVVPDELVFKVSSNTETKKYKNESFKKDTKYSIRYEGESHILFNTGYSNKGKKQITITFPNPGEYTLSNIKVSCLPIKNIKPQTKALKEDKLKNISINNNVIKGNIELKEDKILCLSIPYSKGFTAYVDSEKAELLQTGTMLMSLPLKAGKHSIKLVYHTPYLKHGMLLSAVGFAALIATVTVYEIKRKKENSTESL